MSTTSLPTPPAWAETTEPSLDLGKSIGFWHFGKTTVNGYTDVHLERIDSFAEGGPGLEQIVINYTVPKRGLEEMIIDVADAHQLINLLQAAIAEAGR